MKTRNFKNNDFSKQFDNLTLKDIITKKETGYIPEKYLIAEVSNPDDFIGRMLELPPVIPARYVWHVSHRGYGRVADLETFSIAKRGILREYNHYGPAVFAHNRLYDLAVFYPFNIDMDAFANFTINGEPAPSGFFLSCGYWRIDTRIFKGKWYVDPNLKNDLDFKCNRAIHYICTPEDIPSCALRYFEFDMEVCLRNLPSLDRPVPGGLHQFSYLRPVEKVNQWIRRFGRAA
jgi:hypothetical protein